MEKSSGNSKLAYEAITGLDVLDAQIETNSDLMINKIMYYLSRLPLQLSFSMMKDKLYLVCEYKRFANYIEAWMQQPDQMMNTRVLFTDMDAGKNELPVNCSYLKKTFFDEHPTEKPEAVQASEIAEMTNLAVNDQNDDDYKSAKVQDEDEEAEQNPALEVDEEDELKCL